MEFNSLFFIIGIGILAITIGYLTSPPIGFLIAGGSMVFMALFSKYFD